MQNTLLIGDHLLVDRTTLAPPTKWAPFVHYRTVQRGDIIVFLKPNAETPDLILVKRAIGIPGDRIHLVHGTVFLNGVAQNEPYAVQPDSDSDSRHAYVPYRDDFPSDIPRMQQQASANNASLWALDLPNHIQNGDIVVPRGSVFAMGDNRTESLDGRFWGFVPLRKHHGPPHVHLLVLQDARRSGRENRHGRPHRLHVPRRDPHLRRHALVADAACDPVAPRWRLDDSVDPDRARRSSRSPPFPPPYALGAVAVVLSPRSSSRLR